MKLLKQKSFVLILKNQNFKTVNQNRLEKIYKDTK